jgi:hypothetical protein
MFGETKFSQIGDNDQPSPSLWADCPQEDLNTGLGYFVNEDFLGGPIDSSFADGEPVGAGKLTGDGDTGALSFKAAEVGGYLTVATGANDNDAIALFTAPMGAIVKNSGNKLWAEIRLELTTLFDGAVAFGFGEEAACVRDLVADNPSNSAQAGTITESFVGFVTVQASSAIATVDAVYKKDGGTIVTALANVTNATAIPSASRANLAATTELKLGLRFDGRDKIHFYVNGYKVFTQTVDSTVDQTHTLAPVVAIKTGTANAKSISIDWMRGAFQSRR